MTDFLRESERAAVFRRVIETAERRFVDPKLNGVNFRELARAAEPDVVKSTDPEEFEQRVNALLLVLGTSHTGFFHESRPRSPGRIAIASTFMKADTSDGHRWVFQDVHPGGVAARAGLKPGDVLLTIDGTEVLPPKEPMFELGKSFDVAVRRAPNETHRTRIIVPASKGKSRPLVVPDQVVTASRLDGNIAYIKVSMFPGMIGIDVARDISRAIHDLDCPKLIVDLRGNTGGGIGCLRLMSHMVADRRGVGYSVGRAAIEKGYDKERLPRFDRIPSSKWGILPLAARFACGGQSVAVFTEGLGRQQHQGNIVLLVNEHSASASEMVAAFAAENQLARLVGVKTAGRLVAANSFKVGSGYRVALAVASYFTWHGASLEGTGIRPSCEVPLNAGHLGSRDDQLQAAIAALNQA